MPNGLHKQANQGVQARRSVGVDSVPQVPWYHAEHRALHGGPRQDGNPGIVPARGGRGYVEGFGGLTEVGDE